MSTQINESWTTARLYNELLDTLIDYYVDYMNAERHKEKARRIINVLLTQKKRPREEILVVLIKAENAAMEIRKRQNRSLDYLKSLLSWARSG